MNMRIVTHHPRKQPTNKTKTEDHHECTENASASAMVRQKTAAPADCPGDYSGSGFGFGCGGGGRPADCGCGCVDVALLGGRGVRYDRVSVSVSVIDPLAGGSDYGYGRSLVDCW